MSWNKDNPPVIIEKIMSAACYLPMGFFIGILYILFKGPGCDDRFFRFNFYQSIMIQILFTVLQYCSTALLGICEAMIVSAGQMAGQDFSNIVFALGNTVSVFLTAFFLLLAYGGIWALIGKYAEIPFISNVVRQNLR